MKKDRYWALVDVDNCYCSVERSFRPDLIGKPVVVLSNNDGCVVARSNEAKAMGIKEGIPFFQLKEQFPRQRIYAFSSNYELIGDMTRRLMNIVRQSCPEFHRYSVDEGFCLFDNMEQADLKAWGTELHQRILKGLGMPVSIGIARTKTLAKVASKFAKRYPGYHHCCWIDSNEKRLKALRLFPINDVWGIGRRWADRLHALQINTALDFAQASESWVRTTFNVVAQRTWRELNGEDCIPVDDMEMVTRKSICTSRSFPETISSLDKLRTHVANYAVKCAEKLRRLHCVARAICVFIDTNRFREDLPQYSMSRTTTLLTPSDATQPIVTGAMQCLEHAFQPGFQYKRAGVLLFDISNNNCIQPDLFDFDKQLFYKWKRIDEVVDKINRTNGSETVVLGAQQYTAKNGKGKANVFTNAIRHELRSPNYTTRWNDILRVD
ncbi:MAG: Y-family DNA polymerase [Prevotella sp.]|jgi:DNA polymerase V